MYMPYYNSYYRVATNAVARIVPSPLAPNLTGYVLFTEVPGGTNVFVNVQGLPPYKPATATSKQVGPHGFHIHAQGDCTLGDPNEPFKASGEHYNPTNQPHGNHVGDFPVLFSNNGAARMLFFTNKFKPADVIGKSVLIHEGPDDYQTQPAGGSGRRIGCGVITVYNM